MAGTATAHTLSWGECTIEATAYGSGATGGTFSSIVDGTTQLSPTQGEKLEALTEGAKQYAVKYKATKYVLTFDVYIDSGAEPPISDGEIEGELTGEHVLVIKPTDTGAKKVTINRAKGFMMYKYDTATGIVLTYTFEVLEPASGKQITIAAQS